MSEEITHIDYDSLLKIFISKDELRPALCQANTIGDKTYATDAHSIIIIPNTLLIKSYECHPKTPNIQYVLDQLKDIEPLHYKDVSLFRIMGKQPKDYDTSPCKKCEGEGNCSHCGETCSECDGDGWVDDASLPMIYNDDKTYIQVRDKMFSAFQMGRLEKVITEMYADTFTLIKEDSTKVLFKIGEVEVCIVRMNHEDHEERPTEILKPINNGK